MMLRNWCVNNDIQVFQLIILNDIVKINTSLVCWYKWWYVDIIIEVLELTILKVQLQWQCRHTIIHCQNIMSMSTYQWKRYVIDMNIAGE